MKKIFILPILIIIFISPLFCLAQDSSNQDTIFKAEVIEIIAEEKNNLPNGSQNTSQHLKLKGLEGEFKNKEIDFNGLGDLEVINNKTYQKGDKVLVAASYMAEGGEPQFYIVDYVRYNQLWVLAIVFLVALILVGSWKGFRSLISLILTFVIIIKFIIPQILSGVNPLFITVLGSFIILLAIVYITEGFHAHSHLSVVSIFISLLLTTVFSLFFVKLTKLTGASSEEVLFLFNISSATINLQGLLLAGVVIGALGVLDDVVISQVVATEEIYTVNPNLSLRQLFKKSYRIGTSHIASMTNTLFLAYAGVSLPLLILFVSGQSSFGNWTQALNTELIATEIVRALAGSIGLILSVPIATLISSWWFTKKNKDK